MRTRQLSFLPKISLEHGGETRIGRRKIARPIDPKRPIHIVMRSSMARGSRSMLAPSHERRIRAIVDQASEKYDVKLSRFVNVGNHLHLLVTVRRRAVFQGFLREITGRIAMLVTGSRKSHPIDPIRGRNRFWDHPAYTRIVSWGRDLATLKRYFIKNHFEAANLLSSEIKRAGFRIVSLKGPPD